jgi:selenocysteine lyase/cysteine desulfurase
VSATLAGMNDPFAHIRENVIGEGVTIETPYGPRRLTYADHAASGRAYAPIERQLTENVLPTYGNVHSETSAVAAQTAAFREEARELIKLSTGCGKDDVAIFTGCGVTGAVATLIRCMQLDRVGAHPKHPVVFVGPFEHHSNELPWRESRCDVVVGRECQVDGIDLDDLAAKLEEHRGRPLIGSFSAASNVTGRLTNVEALASTMHHAGGVALFDYAAAGPYVPISMDYPRDPLGYADAIFLSVHKFLGGPGSPGVLLAKKHLFGNRVPAVPGGGTISYVSPRKHTYLADIEHREEGGTPNIPGCIRAGLAVQLKSSVGAEAILAHEQAFARAAIAAWRDRPNLTVLGDLDAPRLGTVSFLVSHEGRPLHHNFVVALLNDLFGIQARGGNSCAAPYAHRLLRVGEAEELAIEHVVAQGWHGCKPGWTRISFGWYDSRATLDFVVRAVLFVADHGQRFLDDYAFNPKSGTWRHRNFEPPFLSLSSPVEPRTTLPESVRDGYLARAAELAEVQNPPAPFEPTPFEHLRWFWLPGEPGQQR